MKVLFIGGTHDGKRLDVRNISIPPLRVPKNYNDIGNPILEARTITEQTIEIEHYLPRKLMDSDGADYVVFQYDDDNLCPLARLIDGYRST